MKAILLILLIHPELSTIKAAAMRNNCHGEDFTLLLAIRKAENGGSGKEFGIKHPKAWDTSLDVQAGWAAATIMQHHKRYPKLQGNDFIISLADRYCPVLDDPTGNKNWKKNVIFYFNEMK